MCRNFLVIGAALICFLSLVPVLGVRPADAQTQSTVDVNRERELDARIEVFFNSLQRGNITLAFDTALRSSALGSTTNETSVAAMRSRVEATRTEFGSILDWEKYETKWIGDDVILIRYILKYEHYPTMWTFAYYRTSSTNSWQLVGLNFDTDVLRFSVLERAD